MLGINLRVLRKIFRIGYCRNYEGKMGGMLCYILSEYIEMN